MSDISLIKFYHVDWKSELEMPEGFDLEPPLGIVALKSYLEDKGFDAKAHVFYMDKEISDLILSHGQEATGCHPLKLLSSYKKNEKLFMSVIYYAKLILKNSPKVIGFSIYETDYVMALLVASFLKEFDPKLKIICGGPQWGDFEQAKNALSMFEFIDGAIIGEGEYPLYQYMSFLDKKNQESPFIFSSIIRFKEKLITNKNVKQVDLDELPIPNFDDLAPQFLNTDKGTISLSLSRGCIARCEFCAEVNYWKTYRLTSPERAVKIIETLSEKYKIKNFTFVDSLINGDINWLKSFINLLNSSPTKINWYTMGRVDPRMDDNFLKEIKKSGCVELYLGIESGSQNVLNSMKKGLLAKNISPYIKKVHNNGIRVQGMFMFAYPTETIKDALLTIKLIEENIEFLSGILVQRFYLQRNSNLFKQLQDVAFQEDSIQDSAYYGASYLNKEDDFFLEIFGDVTYENFDKQPFLRNSFTKKLNLLKDQMISRSKSSNPTS